MEGFCVILLETPARLQVCFDNLTLSPGELFKGVRNIPFGAHLICTSLKKGKSSFFVFADKPEIFVYKWVGKSEEYQRLDTETELMYEACLNEFLPMMVEYSRESLLGWQELTSYISQETISKIQNSSSQVLSTEKEYNSNPTEFESFELNHLLYYTNIPRIYSKPDMTPSEVTRFNHDKSRIFMDLMEKEFLKPESLFGELQFSFVSFLIGENFESLEQWKELLILLCNCEEAMKTFSKFFIDFIPVLYNQVKNLPKDMVFDPFFSNSFVTSCLKSIVSMLQDSELPIQLQIRISKLRALLQAEFGITEFEMLNDEEAPVIV